MIGASVSAGFVQSFGLTVAITACVSPLIVRASRHAPGRARRTVGHAPSGVPSPRAVRAPSGASSHSRPAAPRAERYDRLSIRLVSPRGVVLPVDHLDRKDHR